MSIKTYSLEEICQYLEQEKPDAEEKAKFEPHGLRCPLATGRGMGGFSKTAVLIPESVHIIVSPPACGRHADFDFLAAGIRGRLFRIRLTEQEIISGTAADMVKKEVLELISSLEVKPKAVTLCITCVDALINTDYTGLKKVLKNEYGIRFGIIQMFPFMAESIIKHTELLIESVYSMIEPDRKNEKKAVNLLGKTTEAKENTDFFRVLENAGYQVHEIHRFNTIEEFDEMGTACLNVVLNEHSLYAAKMMKRKYGIPFIEFMECMDPQKIRENYRRLEAELGCTLDIEEYYQAALKKREEFRALTSGKSFATGGAVSYHPVKAACDMVKLGGKLSYFTVDQIRKKDLEYFRWLREHSEETRVYLASDSEMMRFIDEPQCVDYTLGVEPALFLKAKGTVMLKTAEEPYDFMTFIEAVGMMEEIIRKAAVKTEEGKEAEKDEMSLFARNWSIYGGKK